MAAREIRLKVVAGAGRESVTEAADGRLVISVRAPRKAGLANARAIELLALHLSLPREKIHIVKGKDRSSKLVQIY